MTVEVVPILRVRETSGVTFGLISIDLTEDRLTLEVTSAGCAARAVPGDPFAFGLHLAPWTIVDTGSGEELRRSSGHGAGTNGRRRLRWSFHLEERPAEVRISSFDGGIEETVALDPVEPIADPATYSASDAMSWEVAATLMHIRVDAVPAAVDAVDGPAVSVRDRTARPVAIERWANHDVVRFHSTDGRHSMRPVWRFDRLTPDGVQPGIPVGAGCSGREAWTRVAFVRNQE